MAQTAAAAQASQASQAAMAAAQQAAAQQTLNKAAMDAANAATAAMGLMGALPAAAGKKFQFDFCHVACFHRVLVGFIRPKDVSDSVSFRHPVTLLIHNDNKWKLSGSFQGHACSILYCRGT